MTDNDEYAKQMEGDVARQQNDAASRQAAFTQQGLSAVGRAGLAQGTAFAAPTMARNNPTAWLPNSLQANSSPFDIGRRGSMPPAPGNFPPSVSYELAMIQAQREAMEAEQLNLQRMSQALGFARRRSSMSEVTSIEQQATERLKKRRRIASPPMVFSSQKGNSFPMPPLKGDEREIRIDSMETFRQLWEKHIARSKLLFPDSVEKQKEYVRWRFSSALGGCRVSLSAEAA